MSSIATSIAASTSMATPLSAEPCSEEVMLPLRTPVRLSLGQRLMQRLTNLMTYDCLPQLDPYIQWLRQPLGWFVFAMVACVLVGLFLSPLAWSLAGGLLALLSIGVAYPWLSVRGVRCQLTCELSELEEGETQFVTITVKNRCPWPVCGLIIERFLVTPEQADLDVGLPSGDVALAHVPWLSSATFRLPIRPQWRGRYPLDRPQLTCAFPLAIWTARKELEQVQPIIVRPRQIRVSGLPTQAGNRPHHCGTGQRSGGHGDFLGLRAYQPGDSIRHIHWAHTARTDALVVCQRGAAEQALWTVMLDASSPVRSAEARENLAWRVRIAASLCRWLQGQQLPFELQVENQPDFSAQRPGAGSSHNRYERALDRLTDLPLDGYACSAVSVSSDSVGIDSAGGFISRQVSALPAECCLSIRAVTRLTADGNYQVDHTAIEVTLHAPQSQLRSRTRDFRSIIALNEDVALQLSAWLQRTEQGSHAA